MSSVHITAYCPECQSRYQLHADLRGRKMRCPSGRRRWAVVWMVMLGLGIACAIGYGITHVVRIYAQDEDTRRADAEKDYQAGAYGKAAKKYHELSEKYSGSPRAAEYRLLADLG